MTVKTIYIYIYTNKHWVCHPIFPQECSTISIGALSSNSIYIYVLCCKEHSIGAKPIRERHTVHVTHLNQSDFDASHYMRLFNNEAWSPLTEGLLQQWSSASARTSLASRENRETWDRVHRPQDPVGKRANAGVWENCPPDAKAWDRSYHFSLFDSSDV